MWSRDLRWSQGIYEPGDFGRAVCACNGVDGCRCGVRSLKTWIEKCSYRYCVLWICLRKMTLCEDFSLWVATHPAALIDQKRMRATHTHEGARVMIIVSVHV